MSVPLLTVVSTINDAGMLINALVPLVQQALQSGQTEVSDQDLVDARSKLSAGIQALDAMIAASSTLP